MNVPKRRPPRPHSCSRSRSPLRQWAAAKPSQLTQANSTTQTMSAVQFTPCTARLRGRLRAFEAILGGEIDHRGEHGADQDPQQLVPVEERDADPGGLDAVVE